MVDSVTKDEIAANLAEQAEKNRLAKENERLKAELVKLQGRMPTIAESTRDWPKVEKIYLYSNREAMRDLGERIGLTPESIMDFKFAFMEVPVTIEINEDGTYKVLEHDLV